MVPFVFNVPNAGPRAVTEHEGGMVEIFEASVCSFFAGLTFIFSSALLNGYLNVNNCALFVGVTYVTRLSDT